MTGFNFMNIAPPKWRILILLVISFISTWLVFKHILKIALQKNIVDNPDARKLQKTPVPVLGGVAVFFGIVVGLGFFKTTLNYTTLFPLVSAMIMMLYVGTIDDIVDLSPMTRMLMEVLVGVLFIFGSKSSIVYLDHLWGVEFIPDWLSMIISIIAFVGLINAINMIDGVDGLSSALGITICSFFGVVFFLGHQYSYAALAAITVGALLPFFLHNVFGLHSKMFLGDGGSMVLGTIIAAMVITMHNKEVMFPVFKEIDFNIPAFAIAVLSMPIADTLRVMVMRMIGGKSPFKPDKTHLHHRFIALGFSHIAITLTEVIFTLLVVGAFTLVWTLGGSDDLQLYVVIATAALINFGTSAILAKCQSKDGALAHKLKNFAKITHIDRKGIWLTIQKIVDGKSEFYKS
ncbi:MAG: undecaprenyl/decaprenyl-phosphate alpha-N-acetylglucosaminyl 1-phosphate transferase [Bacteroidales bacterium]|nr:undecaprenyl/decaprenyl-phosphate alpha-N-acetylglucosaminyl 1-phosphate transferase [Bacteroidales bacterium]